MNNIIATILLIICYSQWTTKVSYTKPLYNPYYTYLDLYKYREHLTAYKDLYFNTNLDYRVYEAHEHERNKMLLKYAKCVAIIKWIETGEIMVRALNSSAMVKNDEIYAVYWVKLEELSRTCEK